MDIKKTKNERNFVQRVPNKKHFGTLARGSHQQLCRTRFQEFLDELDALWANARNLLLLLLQDDQVPAKKTTRHREGGGGGGGLSNDFVRSPCRTSVSNHMLHFKGGIWAKGGQKKKCQTCHVLQKLKKKKN